MNLDPGGLYSARRNKVVEGQENPLVQIESATLYPMQAAPALGLDAAAMGQRKDIARPA